MAVALQPVARRAYHIRSAKLCSARKVPIHEVFQLFVVGFLASPGAVPQLLGNEIQARSGLRVRLDARLPKEDPVGFSSRSPARRELS